MKNDQDYYVKATLQNLVYALQFGMIDWFEFLERARNLPLVKENVNE